MGPKNVVLKLSFKTFSYIYGIGFGREKNWKTFGIGIVRILDLVNHSEDTHMMNNILPTLYLQHLIV